MKFASLACCWPFPTAQKFQFYKNLLIISIAVGLLQAQPSTAYSEQTEAVLLGGSDSRTLSNSELETSLRRTDSSIRLLHRRNDVFKISFEGDSSVNALCKRLRSARLSDLCEPNITYSLAALPNDPLAPQQWHLDRISAPNAWSKISQISDESMVIAILDTGADYLHPDLETNIWENLAEIPYNGIDDDGNGYIDDIHGINAALGTGDPMDDNGHGTHVAGIVAAAGDNSIGLSGVIWNAKILPLKFLGASGAGNLYNAVLAIKYIIELKKRGVNISIVNASWGSYQFSQILSDAIFEAGKYGILFVAAAGNSNLDIDSFPFYPAALSANLENVISVAATDQSNKIANFSNFALHSVTIAAPGVDILSTLPNGKFGKYSGTSMAAPVVTGVAALTWASYPNLKPFDVRNQIVDTAIPIKLTVPAGSSRLVNAERAVFAITSPVEVPFGFYPVPKVKLTVPKVLSSDKNSKIRLKGLDGSSGDLGVIVKNNYCILKHFTINSSQAVFKTSLPQKPAIKGKVRFVLQVGKVLSKANLTSISVSSNTVSKPSKKKGSKIINEWCKRLRLKTKQIK